MNDLSSKVENTEFMRSFYEGQAAQLIGQELAKHNQLSIFAFKELYKYNVMLHLALLRELQRLDLIPDEQRLIKLNVKID